MVTRITAKRSDHMWEVLRLLAAAERELLASARLARGDDLDWKVSEDILLDKLQEPHLAAAAVCNELDRAWRKAGAP